jgi:hypothetical protein
LVLAFGIDLTRMRMPILAKSIESSILAAKVPYSSVKPNKNILELIPTIVAGKSGVRDYFQFLLLAFVIIFIGIAVYAYVILR